MATAKLSPHGNTARRAIRIAGVTALALFLAGAAATRSEAVAGTAQAGTAYGAKNACSCRYVAGRALDDCYRDFVPGMDLIWLSEDADEKSVTARIPLVASTTATFREGYGCVLEAWEG